MQRRLIACAILCAFAALPVLACTDGTTPDCSGPEAGCAPDLSGQVSEAGQGFDANHGYGDAATPADTGVQPVIDAGDALDAADAHG